MSLEDIRTRLNKTCAACGRNPDNITLVAVSKARDTAAILSLIAQGQRIFGENRVQEAMEKFPRLRETHDDIRLHLIGHLQTNKARDAVRTFDMIDSVDRIKLAASLAEEMDRQNRHLPCLIQVNTGEEAQKGGVAPRDLEALFRFATEEAKLNIRGLMCIPPADDIPAPHFALLRRLAHDLSLPVLSMGMSGDFETAIRFGATEIRVGSALFAA